MTTLPPKTVRQVRRTRTVGLLAALATAGAGCLLAIAPSGAGAADAYPDALASIDVSDPYVLADEASGAYYLYDIGDDPANPTVTV
ncbi:MAG: hypothetical protein LBJ62_08115, partial [Bifidobacteriaceae bacterium]|nr:hypothetical protein [Bifidobacteriaceae bacterium]